MYYKLAVFDFDGTLTNKDSFLEFIKFTRGKWRFLTGFLIFSPIIIAYKLKLIPNWKAKEIVFAYFFKGTSLQQFDTWGQAFAAELEKMIRPKAYGKVIEHQHNTDEIVIVSASIENWIRPWANKMGISNLLATSLEIDKEGLLTGKFLTKNCFGQEKVNRILQAYPERDNYFLEAYGDSSGDRELLAFANKGWYRHFE
nr:HAD-IB family hydrolase [Mucilaginibacter sp. L294]